MLVSGVQKKGGAISIGKVLVLLRVSVDESEKSRKHAIWLYVKVTCLINIIEKRLSVIPERHVPMMKHGTV